MITIISKPICVYCGKKFPTNSEVYENLNGFCYCSIECILKSKGFTKVKWDEKYIAVNDTIKSCANCKFYIGNECTLANVEDLDGCADTCKYFR